MGKKVREFDELRRQWEAQASRALASFGEPRFPTRSIVKLGVPRTTLTNWLTKKAFPLDADARRLEGSSRMFSVRDGIVLAAASNLVAMGLPFSIAKEVATDIAESVALSISTINMIAGQNRLLAIFRKKDEWVVVPTVEGAEEIPAVHVTFDVDKFTTRVMEELGFLVARGKADELRARTPK